MEDMAISKGETGLNWMSIDDLIEDTGMSRNTAYKAAKDGTLPVPVFQIGRKYYIPRKAWEQLKHGGFTAPSMHTASGAEGSRAPAAPPEPPASYADVQTPNDKWIVGATTWQSLIYFIQSPVGGPVKIGVTSRVTDRLLSYVNSNPFRFCYWRYARGVRLTSPGCIGNSLSIVSMGSGSGLMRHCQITSLSIASL